jgi:hypothetical protein
MPTTPTCTAQEQSSFAHGHSPYALQSKQICQLAANLFSLQSTRLIAFMNIIPGFGEKRNLIFVILEKIEFFLAF